MNREVLRVIGAGGNELVVQRPVEGDFYDVGFPITALEIVTWEAFLADKPRWRRWLANRVGVYSLSPLEWWRTWRGEA